MNISLPSIYPVTSHTNHVGPGSTFVAVKGHRQDGITYILQALQQGATTIVVQKEAILSPEIVQAIEDAHARLIRVENTRATLAQMSAESLGHPAKKLRILAITGTKGKTTSAWLLFNVLKAAGYKTALLSTVKNYIGDVAFPTELTTQHPDYLHVFFDACVKAGVSYVVMEVAAQASSLHRIETLLFDGLIFTNFDQEHAEFYDSLHDYFEAKKAVVARRTPTTPVIINADSAWCQKLIAEHPDYITFSARNNGMITIHDALSHTNGISFSLSYKQSLQTFSCPALVGIFNVENCAAVIALALAVGIDLSAIKKGLLTFQGVPGRLARYTLSNGALCFIDYAHNPSSFAAVLPLLKSLTRHLIVVFGCGGDRDRTKRPLMGAEAVKWADMVILTTDNPRSEDPAMITEEIGAGIDEELKHKVIRELDRKKAIELAYAHATSDSVIALLGKGPDEYQQFGMIKFFFSEAEIIKSL